MPLGRSPRLTERDDVRFLVHGIRMGLVTTLLVCLGGALYYADTWERENRALLMGLSLVFGVLSLVLLPLRFEGLVEGRWRDAFFAAWSSSCVAGMGLCLYLDGGGSVPASFGMALPLAFAGLMYPLRGAIAVAALDIAWYFSASLARPHDTGVLVFATSTLFCMAMLCVWTAWWQNRQRRVLAQLSRTDPLTGCLNRRGIEDLVVRAVDDGAPFALLTLDLDDFKAINDRCGHAAGDAVLCDAVRRLRDAIRPEDAVGRLGGDEFAVLLPGASAAIAAQVRDRAELALSVTAPASFGAAAFPADATGADALFMHADAGVYARKRRAAVAA